MMKIADTYLIVLIGLFAALPTRADTVPADISPAVETSQTSETNAIETQQTITKYQEQIQALQAEYGPYHIELSESLMGLGLAYSAQNNHQQAAEVFREAWHINRVNEGLHTLSQLPYLELLLRENTALRNIDEINDNYHYLLWVHKRNYGKNDPHLLPVINRIGQWYIKSYPEHKGRSYDDLIYIRDLHEKAIDIIETNYGSDDVRLITPLQQFSIINYFLSGYADNIVEASRYSEQRLDDLESEIEYLNTNMLSDSIPLELYAPEDQLSEYVERRQKQFLMLRLVRERNNLLRNRKILIEQFYTERFVSGQRALEKIVSIQKQAPELNIELHATSLVALGDWYLIFGEEEHAILNYKEAYNLIYSDKVDAENNITLLNEATPLPDLAIYDIKDNLDRFKNDTGTSSITVTFNVSSKGKASDIEFVEPVPDDNKGKMRTIKKYLKSTRFRPQFKDGEPVDSSKTFKYVNLDQ